MSGCKRKKRLKSGFTTGTAAAAAAKAALLFLMEGTKPSSVKVNLLTGDAISIPVKTCRKYSPNTACCTVIKDAGDDPDITHKAEIGALVTVEKNDVSGILVDITGSWGVGLVTKPGLEVAPGEFAINPGPRKMIFDSVQQVMGKKKVKAKVKVEIFVPDGERLAEKTLNRRLGIIGGISILGTTGIVRPLSHDAYIATIHSSLSVAAACNCKRVVLTTGRRSERFAQKRFPELPEEAFIQMGDFFAETLFSAKQKMMESVIIAVFFAKALKIAQGAAHTHASRSELSLKMLASVVEEKTGDAGLLKQILNANTARHALEILRPDHLHIAGEIGKSALASAHRFSGNRLSIGFVIFDYDGSILFERMPG